MTRNMRQWVEETRTSRVKKPLPILSFPCVQPMGITVRELVNDGALQAKGMKLVADRVDAAAAVSLMDLSVEAEAFGATVRFSDDEVPTVLGALVSEPEEAEALAVPEVGAARTGRSVEAIGEVCKMVTDRPVLAGVIGPFSLAGRLMNVSEAMIYCYDEPEMVHTVLEKCVEFTVKYCEAFKKAGANGVMIAEPLAGLMSPALAAEFSHPYVKKIVDAVQTDEFAVIYHNCGDCVSLMGEGVYSIGAMGYHFGDKVDLPRLLREAPADVLVMGNVSPAEQFRNGTPESMREATLKVMEECCYADNFVISSGCDIPAQCSWENIDAFFAAAKEFYAR